MKLYDNDSYRDEFMNGVYALLSSDPTRDRANQIIDLFDLAPAVEATAELPNGPLTLDELRGMSGEPVWIVGADDDAIEGNGYAVVEFARSDIPQVWWFGNEVEMMPLTENYGKTWRAYRRRPEAFR